MKSLIAVLIIICTFVVSKESYSIEYKLTAKYLVDICQPVEKANLGVTLSRLEDAQAGSCLMYFTGYIDAIQANKIRGGIKGEQHTPKVCINKYVDVLDTVKFYMQFMKKNPVLNKSLRNIVVLNYLEEEFLCSNKMN